MGLGSRGVECDKDTRDPDERSDNDTDKGRDARDLRPFEGAAQDPLRLALFLSQPVFNLAASCVGAPQATAALRGRYALNRRRS